MAVVGVPGRAGRTPRTSRRRRPPGRRAPARRVRPAAGSAARSQRSPGRRRAPPSGRLRRRRPPLAAPPGVDLGGAARPGAAHAGGGVPRRLGDVRRALGEPDHGHAGRDVQVRGRLRAGHHPAGQRQPLDRHAEPGARARPARRALGRGPVLLLQPRLRSDRYRPGAVEPGHRRGRRRLDHHPAVREGLHRAGLRVAVAQVQGDRPRRQDLPGADQGPDPRELPERHLPRPRRLRHPGGQPGLLRQGRQGPLGRRGRDARRHDPVAVAVGPGEEPREVDRAVELRPRRHGRPGLAAGRGPRPGEVPRVPAGGAAGRRDPGRRGRPRLQARDGRARSPRDHRPGDQHRGSDDRPDDRLEAPGAGRRGRDEGAQGSACEPAGCAGVGRPQDRGDHRLLRRVQRRGRRLRAGSAPARVVVQAVRAVGGAAGLPSAGRAREHLRRVVAAELPGCPGGQLRRLQLQPVHGAAGDDQVGEHRLLQDRHRHRPAAGGRRGAPGRDPVGRAADPDGGHRAGRQGGPPDRHGVGVRDVRGRRHPPRRLRGVEGDGRRRPGHLRPRHGDRAAGRAAAGRPERHRGDDRRCGLRRDRPRRPAGRRQDRHRSAPDAERAEQGRLDGRLHPVGVDGRLGRNGPERSDQERGRAARVRADAARLDLAVLHDRRATRQPGRAVLPVRRPRHPAGHRHGRIDGRRRELRRELGRRGQGQEEVRQRQQRLGSRVGQLERLGRFAPQRLRGRLRQRFRRRFRQRRLVGRGSRIPGAPVHRAGSAQQPAGGASGQQPLAAGSPTAG